MPNYIKVKYAPFCDVFVESVFLFTIFSFDDSLVVLVTMSRGTLSFKMIEVFVVFGGFMMQSGSSTLFLPSSIWRNCCLRLALRDMDFLLSSLVSDDVCDCGRAVVDGNWSVMGLGPMQGSLFVDENEFLADDEGDGVVGKELFTDTIPESTEYLSLPWIASSGDSKGPGLVFSAESGDTICIESDCLEWDLWVDGTNEPEIGANFIPDPDDIPFLLFTALFWSLFISLLLWLGLKNGFE